MKLIELELFSQYKKIKCGTKFKFKEKQILEILGENGSGKTILFELITDILSYSTLSSEEQKNILKNKDLLFVLKLEIKDKIVVIEKKSVDQNIISYIIGDRHERQPYNINEDLNIIIYSSAKKSILNETYYNLLLKLLKEGKGMDQNNFNFYIREKIKKIIIIYLFIFKEDYLKKIFKDIIDIKPLNKIKIRFNKANTEKILFLKNITERKFENYSEEELSITLNEEDISNIRTMYLKNNQQFFYLLQNLELLNIKDFLKKEKYYNKKERYINEAIEDNYLNNQFSIDEIEFQEGVTYRYLSEGELQLFETIGTIILFQSKEYIKDNLYIFDEPTTHLNVNWLSRYITLLKETLKISPEKREKISNPQILLSTHNTDIMSDLPKSNLHLIKDGEFKMIKEETFGASELMLNRVFFDKYDSVSENVMKELEQILENIENEKNIENLKNIEKIIEIKFANSPEKYNLFRSIDEKILELQEGSN